MSKFNKDHSTIYSYTILKKTNLKVKNKATCAPTINPNVKQTFGSSNSLKYAFKLKMRKTDVFTIP